MKEISVAEYLAKFFFENDIKYIFFVPVIGVKLLKALEKYKIKKIIPHSEKLPHTWLMVTPELGISLQYACLNLLVHLI